MMKIKKQKTQKKCAIIEKLKFQDYVNSLEAAQMENEMNHLQKSKVDVDILNNL